MHYGRNSSFLSNISISIDFRADIFDSRLNHPSAIRNRSGQLFDSLSTRACLAHTSSFSLSYLVSSHCLFQLFSIETRHPSEKRDTKMGADLLLSETMRSLGGATEES